ncbi:radical SAM protein [bacterium]|nr:radical SAM protein [bacterium]
MAKKKFSWADRQLSVEKGFVPLMNKPLSMVLCYPNSYYVAMSSLGFQSMYFHINTHPSVFCDRAVVEDNQPVLGLMTKKPIGNFDIIALSVSYELDYFNIVKMLKKAGINLYRVQRASSDPLIIIGGIAITINPAPLSRLADVFVIGDGEEVINKIIDNYIERKTRSGDDVIEKIAAVDGVYCPSVHGEKSRIKRQVVADLDKYPSQSFVITKNTDFSDKFVIEFQRGCGRRCKFCAADHIYPRPRFRSKDHILEQIEKNLKITKKVGLMGVAVMSHPHINEILNQLIDWGVKSSVSSLRIESINKEILCRLKELGQKSVTLAPETGTDRLRFSINKRFTNELLLEKTHICATLGIREIKLYFMVGLPGETENDITALYELIKECAKFKIVIKAAVNPFIPKPHTPFQLEAMDFKKSLKYKINLLKKLLRTIPCVNLSFSSIKEAYLEGLICRADAQTGENIFLKGGFVNPLRLPEYKQDEKLCFPWDIVDIT